MDEHNTDLGLQLGHWESEGGAFVPDPDAETVRNIAGYETEVVAFFVADDNSSRLVEWDQVVDEMGAAITALDNYPPR